MEYFIGSITTLLIFFIATKMIESSMPKKKDSVIRYSQSRIHDIIKPILPLVEYAPKKKVKRQSRNHNDKTNFKVLIVNNVAYWIKDNAFYMAPMDGPQLDKAQATVVDTMGMDKVELDKMLFIMDELRKDKES